MKTRTKVWTAAAVTVVAAATAGVLIVPGVSRDDRTTAAAPEPTVAVVRTNLVRTEQVDGELGYAGSATVTTTSSAMVTWLPQPGDTISRGQHVYDLDNVPVPLLYGKLPFWRDLHNGVEDGPDVRVLEQNLRALGYGGGLTVDEHFTAATSAAVRKWQKARDVERTGRVNAGDVVVLPGAIRVADVKARIGTRAGGDVLTATGTRKQVTVDLPATKSDLAVRNSKVTVVLPDGRTVTGKITAVGTTAKAPDDPQDGRDKTPTLPVTVLLDDPAETGALDGAPVTVNFRGAVREGVLAVPVNALLALAEGGFGVQDVSVDGTRRIVPVRLGAFANGQVEVMGDGLTAGMKVTVPAG
ncbi:peptidoglycan-binding protein [Paractinoplanes brasiliensis]|uniref:Multidrug efflux pump subunit AcrA (Membrane-fusion protein) n=1 Tax=Paractinoplanes brasiliensis TaxID=52695 RepID=A0A4R6JYJ7_9ACTN|nr:peptidoglycan-binding protein [Actinoplanes brasiliensis]TDO41943.1 multidrug efflux pump subunit AcrA (membrane-fusion protein) [Actinoplanes brasiliensis]GID29775.1 peptidoglycan-binding protein [Actinoplanes brasiliensis]